MIRFMTSDPMLVLWLVISGVCAVTAGALIGVWLSGCFDDGEEVSSRHLTLHDEQVEKDRRSS